VRAAERDLVEDGRFDPAGRGAKSGLAQPADIAGASRRPSGKRAAALRATLAAEP